MSAPANEPLVSVCMPLFNTEAYVGAAIEGVLGQTYRNLELIICDNGSTDRSAEIVEGYAKRDARIRLVKNRRNLGYAGNLHKVTQLARGDFMMVHMADDLAEPEGVATMVRVATADGVDRDNVMIMTDSYVSNREGRPHGVNMRRPGGYDLAYARLDHYQPTGAVYRFRGREALAIALPRIAIVGFIGATMYSRRLFESIEGVYNGLLYSPDLQFNYHLLSRNPDVFWVQEPHFHWRLHEGGQIGVARQQAVPRLAWDAYTYTFHFSAEILKDLGVDRAEIVRTFVDSHCLRKALEEIKDGSIILAFRHLCLGLATYPFVTLRNPKFYLGLAGCALGPVGRYLGRAGYAIGVWRRHTIEPTL